jgi:hypothetical protein
MSILKAPECGAQWWTTGVEGEDDLEKVMKLNLQTCELLAEVNQAMIVTPRTQEDFEKTLKLVGRAQELEKSFLTWEATLSHEWRYNTVAWADSIPDCDISVSEVYPGKIDIFPDLLVAFYYNMARVSRLFLAGFIIHCVVCIYATGDSDYRTTPDYIEASRLSIEMINDIVASIPYHLGWRAAHSKEFGDQGDDGKGKSLGAYFLIWPLFSTLISDFTTDAQRNFIIGRMRYMTEEMGLNAAEMLTKVCSLFRSQEDY